MGAVDERSRLARYGVALVAVAVATGLRIALTPIWGPHAYPIVFFIVAVVITAWFGGWRPALVAMLLSCGIVIGAFMDRPSGTWIGAGNQLGLAVFITCCASVILPVEAMHRAVRAARRELRQRERSDAALRQSEERFTQIADRAPVMLWRTDAGGHCVYLSQAWREITGQRNPRGLGLTWLDAVHSEDRDRVRDTFSRANARQAAFSTEYRLLLPDGQIRWVIDHGNPLTTDGKFQGYVGAVLDVTEHRRAELGRQQFSTVVELSPDFVGICDAQLRPIYVNPAGLALVGLDSVAEAQAASVADFFFEVDRRMIETEFLPRVLREGHGVIDVRFRHFRTGAAVWVNYGVTALRGPAGELAGFATVTRDISERRRSAEALRRKEQQLRDITELAALEIVQNDRELRYLYVNSAYARRWNRRPEDIIGLTVEELLGAAAVESLRPHLDRVFAGQRVEFDDCIRYGDGTARWVHATLVPQFDAQGEVATFVSSIEDTTARRRAEDSLRESEERFRGMTDGLPLLVWVHGPRGEQQFVNRTFCEFFGVAAGEMTGDRWQRLVHPDDLEAYARAFARAVETLAPFHAEVRVRRADGAWRWLESWGQPRLSDSRQFLGYLGTSVDITDRKHADEALRATVETARARAEEVIAIMEAVPALTMIAYDRTCVDIISNRSARQLLRVPSDRTISKSAPAHEAPPYRVFQGRRELTPEELPLQRAAATGQQTRHEEYRIEFEDAPPRTIFGSAVPLFDEKGEVRGAAAAFVDITEYKSAKEALQISEARLQVALAGAEMGVWYWDMRSETVEWSREVYRLFGVESFAGTVAAFLRLIDPADLDRTWNTVREAAAQDKVYRCEYRIIRPDGIVRWMADRGVAEYDEEGRLSGMRGVVIDITDLKESQHQLEVARDEALAANRAKDGFFAALSHELRTPLNPVLLISSDYASDTSLPETIRRDFEFIAQNIGVEARLIDDLLDYNRISRGLLRLECSPVDLHELLAAAVKAVDREAVERSIALRWDLQAPRPVIRGDVVRLRQVVWNVLRNAIKFTGAGGSIVISSRTAAAAGRVVISIRDTGIGMTPGELARAFEPFSQGDHARARQGSDFGGLGLGLAIARQLVALHHGRIWAESDGHGHGTVVHLEFVLNSHDASPLVTEGDAHVSRTLS